MSADVDEVSREVWPGLEQPLHTHDLQQAAQSPVTVTNVPAHSQNTLQYFTKKHTVSGIYRKERKKSL